MSQFCPDSRHCQCLSPPHLWHLRFWSEVRGYCEWQGWEDGKGLPWVTMMGGMLKATLVHDKHWGCGMSSQGGTFVCHWWRVWKGGEGGCLQKMNYTKCREVVGRWRKLGMLAGLGRGDIWERLRRLVTHVSFLLCMLCPGILGPFLNLHIYAYFFLLWHVSHHLLPPSLPTSFYVGCDPLLS